MKAVAGIVALLSLTVFALPDVSAALDSGTVDPTSSVFMFFCGMLVFIMAPAIALFYGGMLRKQSMTSMMAQCLGVMGLVMVIWWVVGYSLAAGGGFSRWRRRMRLRTLQSTCGRRFLPRSPV